MAASFKDRNLLAVIGDEVTPTDFFWSWLTAETFPVPQDSITGLLLAGIGHINEKHEKNFLIVDSSDVHRSKCLSL